MDALYKSAEFENILLILILDNHIIWKLNTIFRTLKKSSTEIR